MAMLAAKPELTVNYLEGLATMRPKPPSSGRSTH
jgi:hypothetical protein